ncbi:hypothetical protein ACH4LN_25630 [Streptomyces albus]|uniref:hypothetical protein n=1 Tax=Streptomyces albus TaxID=1888 RepID=UPI002163BAC7|nr:hypothetical protein [Streptomyces albus]UVN58088.1 hypothetical protein NR995_28870 [Streptomyces albus]
MNVVASAGSPSTDRDRRPERGPRPVPRAGRPSARAGCGWAHPGELRLTPQGSKLFRLADTRVDELDDLLGHGLTDAEVVTLKKLLTQITANAASAGS